LSALLLPAQSANQREREAKPHQERREKREAELEEFLNSGRFVESKYVGWIGTPEPVGWA
jgi:hypothetical protein